MDTNEAESCLNRSYAAHVYGLKLDVFHHVLNAIHKEVLTRLSNKLVLIQRAEGDDEQVWVPGNNEYGPAVWKSLALVLPLHDKH